MFTMRETIHCVYRETDYLALHARGEGQVAIMNSALNVQRTVFVDPTEIIEAIKLAVATEGYSERIPCKKDSDTYCIHVGRQEGNEPTDPRNTRIEIYGGGDTTVIILDEVKTAKLIGHLSNIRGYYEEQAVKQ
ncbi:hypothetical protein BK703_16575 [Bacillus thuringiensis serovar silo]|uniref:hypothetical protein n=2 Tax=Bacillus thuringiensis TaxID=1428 RepID=UPI000A3AE9D7|nr:hypothetical protein [Bacillus thuringiensis]MDA2128686.1 hypothetical protein [Bacillus cereus]MED3275370.1 hypothetical protein [Bacillus thuringiensis]OTW55255.1 hypothetical protein BK703_16575 [Bacillus thuringiensis serovar silo]OTW74313.1 hypothetical protein BK700_01470 [Bacillus thuringiensis serovar toguchini]